VSKRSEAILSECPESDRATGRARRNTLARWAAPVTVRLTNQSRTCDIRPGWPEVRFDRAPRSGRWASTSNGGMDSAGRRRLRQVPRVHATWARRCRDLPPCVDCAGLRLRTAGITSQL